MILHIEAGHRRDADGKLIDCYILTDGNGQHIAATPGASLDDYRNAEAIRTAVNARTRVIIARDWDFNAPPQDPPPVSPS